MTAPEVGVGWQAADETRNRAATILNAVTAFHEKAAEDEKTRADLAAENATLRRLLHIERAAVGRYMYRLRLIRQGVR